MPILSNVYSFVASWILNYLNHVLFLSFFLTNVGMPSPSILTYLLMGYSKHWLWTYQHYMHCENLSWYVRSLICFYLFQLYSFFFGWESVNTSFVHVRWLGIALGNDFYVILLIVMIAYFGFSPFCIFNVCVCVIFIVQDTLI